MTGPALLSIYRVVTSDGRVMVQHRKHDGTWVHTDNAATVEDAIKIMDARQVIDRIDPSAHPRTRDGQVAFTEREIQQLNEACNTIVELRETTDDA